MGIAYFPGGIRTPLLIGGPSADPVVGNVYFVCKTATSNWIAGADVPSAGSYGNPFATIDYAIGKCTASQGDVIYVLPGHTETIAAAGGITCDVAGISIIGLGNGNLRPTVTWSETASSWLITAANVTIKNIRTTLGKDEVVSMFAVSAAGCTLDAIDFEEYGAKGATGQAIQFLLTTADADNLTLQNCRHRQWTAAAADQVWIELVGCTNTRILNNSFYITAKAATGSYWLYGSTATIESEVVGNIVVWLGATIVSPISFASTSSGVIAYNLLGMTGAAVLSTIIVGDAMYTFENYVTDSYATSGTIVPVKDTIT
jgi:hypothetical protein